MQYAITHQRLHYLSIVRYFGSKYIELAKSKSLAKYLLYGTSIRAAAGWWLFFYVRQLFGAMMIPWHVCCGQ